MSPEIEDEETEDAEEAESAAGRLAGAGTSPPPRSGWDQDTAAGASAVTPMDRASLSKMVRFIGKLVRKMRIAPINSDPD
ncbi:hypothetical protein RvVAR0630_28000 [Agrobacterium vitis]|nr:hypothetical protein RvVAR0630_28000 [Agrobacterium vitis]